MDFGLDFVSGPPIAAMKAAGVSFVCRYLAPDNPATHIKLLTPQEAQANGQAGIATVSNFEWYAGRPLEGYGSGVADAQVAASQHAACGGPSTRPIYFSVDENATGEQVAAYFQGVASVLGLSRVGAYGSYAVLQYLFNARLISWGWQTYAWSSIETSPGQWVVQWEPRAQLQQYLNGQVLAGASVDYDRSTVSDYGQWFPQNGENIPMSIDLTVPTIAAYFQLANGNQWLSLRTQTNTGAPIYLHGDMLRYYQTNGCLPYCGFSDAGLPLSNEVSIAQFSSLYATNPTLMQALSAEGCVVVYFQRAVWMYDPKHLVPGEVPTGAGPVYPLQLYGGGPGTDPYITQLKAEIAQMGQQLQADTQQITSLEQEIAQLKQPPAPDPLLADYTNRLNQIETLAKLS